MAGGRILQVHGKNDWDAYQKKSVAEKKLLVVDFTASWCGPCRAIAPVFEQLSNSHTNALFLKVDIDENQDLAMEFGVRGVPAFHLYKGGAKVDELVGANSAALEALVKKHYTEGSFSGQGRTLGSNGPSEPSPPSQHPPKTLVWRGVDESKPVTSVQIRLHDGTRLVGKFNTSHTIGDVRAFIESSKPSAPAGFQLSSSFPPKALTDDAQTIESAGLQNASISMS